MEKDEKFIFRIQTKDYKREKAKLRGNDQYIDIQITKTRVNHIKDKKLKLKLLDVGSLNLRIIKVKLVTGEIEYLINKFR
jgi:hypothetical protein